MKWCTAVLVFAIFNIAISFADDVEKKPFANLEGKTTARWSGWEVNNKKRANYFNSERLRLGADFEKELLKYVDNDLKRHFWCATFLSSEEYLDGRLPMPKLALLLLQQGITLGEGGKGLNTQIELVRMRVVAAILSEKIGLQVQARHYKRSVEVALKENDVLIGAMPALGKADRKVYDGIQSGE